jgi:hypothetical protein
VNACIRQFSNAEGMKGDFSHREHGVEVRQKSLSNASEFITFTAGASEKVISLNQNVFCILSKDKHNEFQSLTHR